MVDTGPPARILYPGLKEEWLAWRLSGVEPGPEFFLSMSLQSDLDRLGAAGEKELDRLTHECSDVSKQATWSLLSPVRLNRIQSSIALELATQRLLRGARRDGQWNRAAARALVQHPRLSPASMWHLTCERELESMLVERQQIPSDLLEHLLRSRADLHPALEQEHLSHASVVT